MQQIFKFELDGANFSVVAFSLAQAESKARAKIHIEKFFGRNVEGKTFNLDAHELSGN